MSDGLEYSGDKFEMKFGGGFILAIRKAALESVHEGKDEIALKNELPFLKGLSVFIDREPETRSFFFPDKDIHHSLKGKMICVGKINANEK